MALDGASLRTGDGPSVSVASGSVGVCSSVGNRVEATPAMPRLAGMEPGDFGLRHARWRAWLRVHTPNVLYYRLGLVVPKAQDCGDHDWRNAGNEMDGCYHCNVQRPRTSQSN